MGQSADQLRQEIAQKRSDAAEKIEAIQAQVGGTVQQVQDTAEQVKATFDVRHQIRAHPLLALGAALIGGFALGGMGGGGKDHTRPAATAPEAERQSPARARQGRIAAIVKQGAKQTGLEATISDMASAFAATVTDKVKTAVGAR